MHNRQCNFSSFPMMGGGIIFWIIGICIIVGIIWFLSTNNKKQSSNSYTSAMAILEDRYARGEIEEVEFINKKRILNER